MIFGRPQVGLDAAVSAGGRGVGHQLCRRVSADENFGRFSYTPELPTPSYPTSVWVLSNEIESWNLLIFSLTFPSRFWLAALGTWAATYTSTATARSAEENFGCRAAAGVDAVVSQLGRGGARPAFPCGRSKIIKCAHLYPGLVAVRTQSSPSQSHLIPHTRHGRRLTLSSAARLAAGIRGRAAGAERHLPSHVSSSDERRRSASG